MNIVVTSSAYQKDIARMIVAKSNVNLIAIVNFAKSTKSATKKRAVTPMTYKQFKSWSLDRTCDGCWSAAVALMSIEIIQEMEKAPFWKRKKAWEKHKTLATAIVAIIEEKIAAVKGSDTNEYDL